jgi:predicted nucleic-acid-binding protein
LIALDSSVILRYLTQDDTAQARAATRLMESTLSENKPGYVSIVVLLETIWVLQRGYGRSPEAIFDIVARLLQARQLTIGDRVAVEAALSGGAGDLADRIIHELGRAAGCSETVTFDRRFARLEGVRLLSG